MAALFAESITSNLKFTAKVPLLMKATSNDEKPTQGYYLQEISRISKSSLPNCQSLLSFLLGRLEKKEPNIKFKVLHLMKYLVINGHSEFRSQLRRNGDAVKQTVNFQGDLDAVHGDGLNVKVQQAASDLEKLLFDVDNPEVDIIYKSMLAPSESNRKMQGFGHSVAPEIKKEPLLMNTLMKVKKSSSEIFSMNKSKTNNPPNEYEPRPNTPPPHYTPVDLEDSELQISNPMVGDRDDEEDEMCEESEIDSDHYYERKLVHNITTEGGLTRTPSKEMLKDFVNKSSQLEMSVILDILNERLQDVSPVVQLKSLCVLEFMLRSNLLNIPREIHEHCPSIHLLSESQDQTLQTKASKIVLAIASCLKQDEIHGASKVVVPPSYNAATELPKMKDKVCNETEAAKEKDLKSLFSGMSVSQGTRPGRQLVETSQPLIDIELTNPAKDDKQTTGKSNPSLLSSPQTNTKSKANQFPSVTGGGAQNFHLMSIRDFSTPSQNIDCPLLEAGDLKSSSTSHDTGRQSEQDRNYYSDSGKSRDSLLQNLDIGLLQDEDRLTQEIGKERLIYNSSETTRQCAEHNNGVNKSKARPGKSNNFEFLNSQASSSSSQHSENLLLLDTKKQTYNPPSALNASHPNPLQNPHSHLLTLPGGLVLPADSSSSSSPRRPFPKDMKSESIGFDFIRKSTKSDAFSFINDEIQASKTKQK